MTKTIQPGLVLYSRRDWGADTSIPRLGHPVNRLDRTEAIIHHTVIIDNDATPNRWETLAEVFGKMRQLQTIRPNLGLDVPYNFVAFHMADGSLVICEGRGLNRTGAHTHAHNTSGVATAGQGNFQMGVSLFPYISHWSRWLGWLKYDKGMVNLGSIHPPGKIAYGHRDLSATACPGDKLYAIIPQLAFQKGGLTMSQYTELKARIAKAEKLHADNRAYRRQVGKLIGQVTGLLQAASRATAQTRLNTAKKQITVIEERLKKGTVVP